MRATVFTSYFLFIPLVTSLYFGIYIHALLIGLSMISSLRYHTSFEKTWARADSIFASLVFIYNLYLCFLFRTKLLFIIPVGVVTLASFFFFYLEKHNYNRYHSVWHLLVITGTWLCALGFGLL